jgi:hypothetical protein
LVDKARAVLPVPLRVAAIAVALSACQCLQPVADCGGAPCPLDIVPGCDAGACSAAPETLAQLLDDMIVAEACDQPRVCGTGAPGVSCDQYLWGVRYQGEDPQELLRFIDAGTMTMDWDAGLACLAAWKTQCFPDCWPPFRGLLGAGATCASSFECQSGLYCDYTSCPFHCAPGLGSGAGASYLGQCNTAAWADLADGGTRCLDPIPLGSSCANAPDEVDNSWRACVPGAVCVPSGGDRVCVLAAGAGEPCLPDGCAEALWCRGRPAKCVPGAKLGEACSADWEDPLLPPCLEGIRCMEGTCAPAGQDGDPCTGLTDCAPPTTCTLLRHRCEVRSNTGGPCLDDFNCGNFHDNCIDGVCQPARELGEPCAAISDCHEELTCLSGVCSPYVCSP